ncbi:MAG: helix-turn-helix domain-containing protein [Bacteroidetes bacterium]|nr:helix-turn-helix domain-containing protein [Bacteroidota bacterium]
MRIKLKYTVIKTREQYDEYCSMLEDLVDMDSDDESIVDEIDLLTALIETYDREHTIFNELDPVELLSSLMAVRNMKATELAQHLNTSRGNLSDILNYKRALSKDMIRKLSSLFKLSQEAFNRQYKLIESVSSAKSKSKKKKVLAYSH